MADLEHRIARLLIGGTYAAVILLGLGVVDLLARGISPLDRGFGSLDLARIPADVVALRPEGYLWLGLVVLIATPSARVAASLAGFGARGERAMALVAAGVLAVIGLSVLAAGAMGPAG